MELKYIKLLVIILLIFGIVYAYISPFTQYEITKQVNDYLDKLEGMKEESLALITSTEQWEEDKKSIDYIAKEHHGYFYFRNRDIDIISNGLSKAKVEVTSIIQIKDKKGNITSENRKYVMEMAKQKNQRGEKVWKVINRFQSK